MEMWHKKNRFSSYEEKLISLYRFVNYYNAVEPHSSLNNQTPFEFIAKFYNISLF